MRDLLLTSFKAQCRYVEPRILEEEKRKNFGQVYRLILMNEIEVANTLKGDGYYLAKDMYDETVRNLSARFDTGVPLETWSIL